MPPLHVPRQPAQTGGLDQLPLSLTGQKMAAPAGRLRSRCGHRFSPPPSPAAPRRPGRSRQLIGAGFHGDCGGGRGVVCGDARENGGGERWRRDGGAGRRQLHPPRSCHAAGLVKTPAVLLIKYLGGQPSCFLWWQPLRCPKGAPGHLRNVVGCRKVLGEQQRLRCCRAAVGIHRQNRLPVSIRWLHLQTGVPEFRTVVTI